MAAVYPKGVNMSSTEETYTFLAVHSRAPQLWISRVNEVPGQMGLGAASQNPCTPVWSQKSSSGGGGWGSVETRGRH